jgi:hypothetical protein
VSQKTEEILLGIREAVASNPALLQLPENAVLFQEGQGLDQMLTQDSSFLMIISSELALPIKQAFAEAAGSVFLSASILVFIGFVLSFFIKEIALREKSGMQEMAEGV